MKFLRKLVRATIRAAKRLPGSPGKPYRPERHYMRGAGPKSKQIAPSNGEQTPNPT
jgi:hypothetical protein